MSFGELVIRLNQRMTWRKVRLFIHLADTPKSVVVEPFREPLEPRLAQDVHLEKIKSPPLDVGTEAIREAVKRYFSTPRIVQNGDFIAVPVEPLLAWEIDQEQRHNWSAPVLDLTMPHEAQIDRTLLLLPLFSGEMTIYRS